MLQIPLEDVAELPRNRAAQALGDSVSPATASVVCLGPRAACPTDEGPWCWSGKEVAPGDKHRGEGMKPEMWWSREVSHGFLGKACALLQGLLWISKCSFFFLFFSIEPNIRAIKKSIWKSDSTFPIFLVSSYCVAFHLFFPCTLYKYSHFIDFIINDALQSSPG